MAEIKYHYAYDENGQLVSINDYTKHDIGDRLVYRKGCMELLKLLPRFCVTISDPLSRVPAFLFHLFC